MVCRAARSIIPSLKLGDYLSVQAHKPCSISHLFKVPKTEELISCGDIETEVKQRSILFAMFNRCHDHYAPLRFAFPDVPMEQV